MNPIDYLKVQLDVTGIYYHFVLKKKFYWYLLPFVVDQFHTESLFFLENIYNN